MSCWSFAIPSVVSIILETAVEPRKKVQDFEPQLLAAGVEHSQKVKATPAASDCGSEDCAFIPDSTAVSRLNKIKLRE